MQQENIFNNVMQSFYASHSLSVDENDWINMSREKYLHSDIYKGKILFFFGGE